MHFVELPTDQQLAVRLQSRGENLTVGEVSGVKWQIEGAVRFRDGER
jgi:hypothetical protein